MDEDEPEVLTLHSYWRSGAAHRVRIALELKGAAYQIIPVNLATGAQKDPAYRAQNPQGFVPMLEARGARLIQSLAIIEWLDEAYPDPPLLPTDLEERAHVRALAEVPACDIHPLGNARVLQHLRTQYGQDEAGVAAWALSWITPGFEALEALMARDGGRGPWAFADAPSLADCAIVPQIYAAQSRYQLDLAPYPRLAALAAAAEAHTAFRAAHPLRQPDAPGAG